MKNSSKQIFSGLESTVIPCTGMHALKPYINLNLSRILVYQYTVPYILIECE